MRKTIFLTADECHGAAPLLNGFIPALGQKFTVVTTSTVTGTFSNTTIPINSTEHFAISYTNYKGSTDRRVRPRDGLIESSC